MKVHMWLVLAFTLAGIRIAAYGQSDIGPAGAVSGGYDCLIAASDSSETMKARADFVCPGTHDEEVIGGVIDSIALNGKAGSVFLAAGTYKITQPVILKSGVSVYGILPGLNLTQNCPDLGFAMVGGTILQGESGNKTETIFSGTNIANLEIANLGFKNVAHAISVGDVNQDGFGFGTLRNLFVDHSSNTCFVFKNCQQMQVTNLKMYWVHSAVLMQACKGGCSPGNSVLDGVYAFIDPAQNPPWTIKIAGSIVPDPAHPGSYLTSPMGNNFWIRPQVNAFSGSSIPNSAMLWMEGEQANGLSTIVQGQTIQYLDLEGDRFTHHVYARNLYQRNLDLMGTCKFENAHSNNFLSNNVGTGGNPVPERNNVYLTLLNCSRNTLTGVIEGYTADSNSVCQGFYYNQANGGWCLNANQTFMGANSRLLNLGTNEVLWRPYGIQIGQQVTTLTGTNTVSKGLLGIVKLDASAGSRTIQLPTASNIPGGSFTFVRVDDRLENTLTLKGYAGETINGSGTYALTSQWDTVTLASDGANWMVTQKIAGSQTLESRFWDLNTNGRGDLPDFSAIAAHWGNPCSSPSWCEGCDLDQNGTVDLADVIRFAQHWLQ